VGGGRAKFRGVVGPVCPWSWLDTFVRLYEIEGGYKPCESDDLELGFEKVAIYVDGNGEVTHAARQTEDGAWTSKLGEWEDIAHKNLDALTGEDPAYGAVAKVLKRLRPGSG